MVPGTLLAADPVEIEKQLGGSTLPPDWAGRAVLVRRAEMLPLECIVRGYLAGQAYEEYERSGTVHGTAMPGRPAAGQPAGRADLHPVDQGDRGARPQHRLRRRRRPGGRRGGRCGPGHLPRALQAGRGPRRRRRLRAGRHQVRAGLRRRRALPVRRGVHARLVALLAGRRRWCPGTTPPAFDKQPLRDWLAAQPWDRTPPPPPLPAEVTAAMSERYVAAYERVTGRSLDDWYGATP